jgi:mRNA interferase MazF
VTLRRGDIHWIEFPPSSTREQVGRRPAIILQGETTTTLPTVFVVPLTTNPRAARFAGTFAVEPSPRNGLPGRSIVLAFQLRALDRTRIGQRIGSLEPADLVALDGHLRSLLSL